MICSFNRNWTADNFLEFSAGGQFIGFQIHHYILVTIISLLAVCSSINSTPLTNSYHCHYLSRQSFYHFPWTNISLWFGPYANCVIVLKTTFHWQTGVECNALVLYYQVLHVQGLSTYLITIIVYYLLPPLASLLFYIQNSSSTCSQLAIYFLFYNVTNKSSSQNKFRSVVVC